MGAIAAVFNKKGEDATSTVSTMLNELKHRETRIPRIVWHPSIFVSQSLGNLATEHNFSKVAVGTNGSEPVLGDNYLLVFEGQFFPPSKTSVVHHFMDKLGHQPLKIARNIIKELDGSYTFAFAFSDKVIVGRDVMGTKPLYYGENESACAIASERKALWKIGITNTHSFPPGNLAIVNQTGFALEPVSTLKPLPQRKIGMIEAAERLQKLLEKSTRERVSDVKKVGAAFSGGLDSSVVSFLAKRAGAHVHPICVGLKGQNETERAKEAAKTLGLPLTLQEYTVGDVKNVLPKVLWLIEEPNVMKAGVAIPFYWTAEIASRLGYNVLLAGQGADELFGGYHRYLNEYAKGGVEKVRESLFHDIAMSFETNFQRDEPVCAYHKVELRLPFVDAEVVSFALSLSVNLKIMSAEDPLRKRVLRQAAKNLGLRSSIADKPKKAVQFATGVDRALVKLAKKEGLTPRSYVNKVFKEVYPAWK